MADSQFVMRIILFAAVTVTVITVATTGALGDSIDQGLSSSEKETDYRIDITEKNRLSDAALFVFHRGSKNGCRPSGASPTVPQQNNNEIDNPDIGLTGEEWYTADYDGGYPALADTYIGLKPSCIGGSSTPAGTGIGGLSPMTSSGGDLEGIYGRVSFEVQEKVTLDARNPDTWLERQLIGVGRGGSFYSKLRPSCKNFVETAFVGHEWAYVDVRQEYVLIFKPDVPDSRANDWLGNYDVDDGLYCDHCTGIACLNAPIKREVPDNHFRVTLCPGDRGYIQMNKAKKQGADGPNNRDEAGQVSTSGAESSYPFIQINSVEQETC
jgi:hypothetical protein